MSYLRKGVSGEPVKVLQAKLGVPADGDFGPGTETALIAYQTKEGLSADGVAGPDTFMKMGLSELVLLAPGASGETVKKLQEALNIGADGAYGPGTAKAVEAFQSAHGLEADGIAGPETLAKLPAFASVITPEKVAASETTAAAAPAALPHAGGAATPVAAPAKSIWATIKSLL